MKKIMVIISLSIFIVMSNAWAQMINLSTGDNRVNISNNENANVNSKLSTGLRINRSSKRHRIAYPDDIVHSPNEFQGQSIFPAIFAYHCNNHDPAVQNCGGHTVPYGNNLFTDVHFTHTWLQIMNTSEVEFTSDNTKMIIEVYGQNGNLIDVNGGPGWYNNGTIDLLDDGLAGSDGFTPRESIFLYFDTWMNDEYADKNPPYSAKLIVYTKLPYEIEPQRLTLNIHVGWEEIIEDDDGQRYAKGGTLIDKETVELKPAKVQEDTSLNVLQLYR